MEGGEVWGRKESSIPGHTCWGEIQVFESIFLEGGVNCRLTSHPPSLPLILPPNLPPSLPQAGKVAAEADARAEECRQAHPSLLILPPPSFPSSGWQSCC